MYDIVLSDVSVDQDGGAVVEYFTDLRDGHGEYVHGTKRITVISKSAEYLSILFYYNSSLDSSIFVILDRVRSQLTTFIYAKEHYLHIRGYSKLMRPHPETRGLGQTG